MHDVGRGGCSEGRDGLLFGQCGGGGGHGDFLCAGLVAWNDGDLGNTIELGERGGDVILAACADHAGHFRYIDDGCVGSQNGGCESGGEGEKE